MAEHESEPVDELARLRMRNQSHLQRLALSGVGVNLLPQLLDQVIQAVFADPDALREFQLGWERRAGEILEEIDREARMAQLRAPGPMVPANGHRAG